MTRLKSRILLADDHALVRRGLRHILDEQPDLEVTAEAADGAEALELAAGGAVDLAILDISMPRMTGLHAARELHRLAPKLPILILTMHENEQYLEEALRAGAAGYVVKKAADRDLVEACRATLRGESFRYQGPDSALAGSAIRRARRGERPRRGLKRQARARDRARRGVRAAARCGPQPMPARSVAAKSVFAIGPTHGELAPAAR